MAFIHISYLRNYKIIYFFQIPLLDFSQRCKEWGVDKDMGLFLLQGLLVLGDDDAVAEISSEAILLSSSDFVSASSASFS